MALNLSQPKRRPRKVMVYGPPGVGKTTWALSAPGVVLLPTEDGAGDILVNGQQVPQFPLAGSYDEVMGRLGELYTEDHQFSWLVIDSADWLETLAQQKVCQDRGVSSLGEIDFGKGYTAATALFRHVVSGLDALAQAKGLGVILVAHSRHERYEDPEHGAYDRWAPKMHKDINAILTEWCDEVFFANFKVTSKKEEAGFGQTKTRATTSGKRVMRTTYRPAAMAKNRLGLPDEIDMTWEAYAQHLK